MKGGAGAFEITAGSNALISDETHEVVAQHTDIRRSVLQAIPGAPLFVAEDPSAGCPCAQAIYREAERVKGDTSENLIGLLERRLDAIVYRSKLVPTVFSARQFVNHGHVLVNGKRVNIPSYRCKVGDVIEVREKSRDMGLVLEATQSSERDTPDYLDVDHTKLKVGLNRIPVLSDVPYPVMMEPNLVIEYYSR